MGKTLFVEQCYNTLNRVQTNYDVFQFLKSLCDEFFFDKFAVLFLPPKGSDTLSSHILISNWSPEFIRAYDEEKLLASSKVMAELHHLSDPVEWTIDEITAQRPDAKRTRARDIFETFDMRYGVCFPTYDATARRGAVTFAGKRGPLASSELATLHLLALYTYNQIYEVVEAQTRTNITLTRREHECLHWTSEGKTSAEIGAILSISDNTVSSYLTAATNKLNAANKCHAVAKAMRLGLLS